MSRVIKKAYQVMPLIPIVVGESIPPRASLEEHTEELGEGFPPPPGGRKEALTGNGLLYGPSKAQEVMELAKERAQRLVEEAQAQVEEVRAQAQKEARAQGLQEGLAEGKRKGEEEIKAQMAAEVARIAQLADQALDFRAQAMEDCEPQLVELALKIARKIIGQELAIRPELAAQMASEALRELNTLEAVVIRVHPDDAPLLEERWASGTGIYVPTRQWQIVADGSISPGGCIIEAPSSQLDARLETKLARIAEAFQEVFAETKEDEEGTPEDRAE